MRHCYANLFDVTAILRDFFHSGGGGLTGDQLQTEQYLVNELVNHQQLTVHKGHDTLGNFVACNQEIMLRATKSRSVSCNFEATLLRATFALGNKVA